MKTICRSLATLLFSFLLLSTVIGQTPRERDTQREIPTELPITVPPEKQTIAVASPVIVSATASSQRVRYFSLGEVNHVRLQVFSVDGAEVFDSNFKLGNLIDWQLSDSQGTRLVDGSYLFLITVKDFSGNLTQKYGTATLEAEQVSLAQSGVEELPSPQATALEANRQVEVLSTVDRVGVAAMDRTTTASPNGTTAIDPVTTTKKTSTADATTPPTTNASATQDHIVKWVDNAGALGDSTMTDVGGLIGIGTTSPQSTLNVNQTAANGNAKGIFLTGDEYFQSGTGTSQTGLLLLLGVNRPGNRQLWVGDRANLGSSTGGFFRIQSGVYNSMDAVTGNGFTRLPLNLGTPTSNVGVGFNDFTTAGPGSKLSVAGGVAVGSTYKSMAAPADGLIVEGNVGIGTSNPQAKLVVNAGGLGGEVRFHTPNGESGMSIIGTNRADIRYDGTTLKLLAGTGPGAMASTNGININGSGNVGIGTTTPAAKLDVVAGGTGINATSQANAIVGISSTANYAAIYGENTSSAGGPGVYGKGTSGYAMYADGNAAQARSKGGWVKAMIFVNADGTVARCFNSQLPDGGASLPPSGMTGCGFSVTPPPSLTASYKINFGFKVDDRFVSITPSLGSARNIGADFVFEGTNQNVLSVYLYVASQDIETTSAPFIAIIY